MLPHTLASSVFTMMGCNHLPRGKFPRGIFPAPGENERKRPCHLLALSRTIAQIRILLHGSRQVLTSKDSQSACAEIALPKIFFYPA